MKYLYIFFCLIVLSANVSCNNPVQKEVKMESSEENVTVVADRSLEEGLEKYKIAEFTFFVSNENAEIKALIRNNRAIHDTINSLIVANENNNTKGIYVSIEKFPKSEKDRYSSFITLLSHELKKSMKTNELYLQIPLKDSIGVYDFPSLIPSVSKFIIGKENRADTIQNKLYALPYDSNLVSENLREAANYYMNRGLPSEKISILYIGK